MRPIYILSDTQVPGARSFPCIRHRFLRPDLDLSFYDYLIFTSKNAVFAIDGFTHEWKNIPALAIGKATARAIQERGGKLAMIASSFYGEDFAKEIVQKFPPSKKFLYLRAKIVSTDVAKLLRNEGYQVNEAIVYETECVECDALKIPEKGAYIIFSSPFIVHCFFRCFSWDPSYKAVAIGKKTAAALPSYIEPLLFEQKTLAQIVEFIRNQSYRLL